MAQVPDHRLDALAAMSSSKKVVHAGVELVDIAGLVAGSSTGEGLGNRFLGGIREADAMCLVLRAFEDPNVPGGTDPLEDLGVLELELVLADLASAETQLERRRKAAKQRPLPRRPGGRPGEGARRPWPTGRPFTARGLTAEQLEHLRPFFMLTNKPVLAVVNLGEDAAGDDERAHQAGGGRAGGRAEVLGVSVKLEAEAAQLAEADRAELMEGLGLGEGALPRVAQAAYRLLGRRTFFTTGDKESRAWTFRAGRQGARVRGRDPFGPPAWLHPGRGRALGRAAHLGVLGGGPGRRQSCGSRARSTRSSTVMSSRSASTSEAPTPQRPPVAPDGKAGSSSWPRPSATWATFRPGPSRPWPASDYHLLRGHPPDLEALEPRLHIRAPPRLPPPLQRGRQHGHGRRAPGQGGATIALVTDAGTPLVSDPGGRLVRAAVAEGIPVEAVPGPSAALAALVVSGLATERWCFEGFLPRSGRTRTERLAAVAGEADRAVVVFESPTGSSGSLDDLAWRPAGRTGPWPCAGS